MKTVLISAGRDVPLPLRELLARGSTTLVEYTADELREVQDLTADRLVIWGARGGGPLPNGAAEYLGGTVAEDRDRVMVVLPDDTPPESRSNVPPDQLFLWPRDEDRLELAFLTGA